MNFFAAVKSCFVNYSTFSGRSPRSEYWNFFLFIVVTSFIADYIDVLNSGMSWWEYDEIMGPINFIWFIVTILPSFAVGIRRLHDINKSGWWILLSITIIGLIPLLYWACKKGDEAQNRFG
tara:strand:- start:52 stop:414 length:363 start_codon:yes stop_codon:yes gene_type:complete